MATKIQLINRKNRLTVELNRVRESIADIERGGVKGLTVSTGDGQKSATALDLDRLYKREGELSAELAEVRRSLRGKASLRIRHRMTTRN